MNRKQTRIRKHFLGMALMLLMLACMQLTVFAGTWKFDGPEKWKWWYQNDDGSYPHDAWAQINGKWYHFDSDGYLDVGMQKINGQFYILERDGDTIGQMRENETHKMYSIDANGVVHQYQIEYDDRYGGLTGVIYVYKVEETQENLFDIGKELGLITGTVDFHSNFGYTFDQHTYAGDLARSLRPDLNYPPERQEDIEYIKRMFDEEFIRVHFQLEPKAGYAIYTWDVKPDCDSYDYVFWMGNWSADWSANRSTYGVRWWYSFEDNNKMKMITIKNEEMKF